MAAAAVAAAALGQLGRDRRPFRLHRLGVRPDRLVVGPLIWIQTLHPVEQSIALLRRPGAASDALEQIVVAAAQTGGG